MKREAPVLEALQLLDDRIQRLEIVHESGAPAIYCDLGFPALAPLAVCGDGVVRLFSFVAELTAVKGGVLLIDEIDEIDAGLHYSVMVPFWRALRKLTGDRGAGVSASSTPACEATLAGYWPWIAPAFAPLLDFVRSA